MLQTDSHPPRADPISGNEEEGKGPTGLSHSTRKNPGPFAQPANSPAARGHLSSSAGGVGTQYRLQGTLEKSEEEKLFGLTIFPDTLGEGIM